MANPNTEKIISLNWKLPPQAKGVNNAFREALGDLPLHGKELWKGAAVAILLFLQTPPAQRKEILVALDKASRFDSIDDLVAEALKKSVRESRLQLAAKKIPPPKGNKGNRSE